MCAHLLRTTQSLFCRLAAFAVVAACSGSATDRIPSAPVPPAPAPGVTRAVHVEFDSAGAYFPGMKRGVVVWAGDDSNHETSSAGALLTISDTGIAKLSSVDTEHVSDQNGRDHLELWTSIRFRAPGTFSLRATLDGLVDEHVLTVRPIPAPTTAVSVDSFSVIETTCPGCGGNFVYLPVLRLHADGSPMAAIAMELDLPADSTGLCDGSVRLAAGQPADLFTYPAGLTTFSSDDWFDWPYEVFGFERLPSEREPDGPVTARVIVRDPSGAFGLVQATGTIQRNVQTLDLPRDYVPSPGFYLRWTCA